MKYRFSIITCTKNSAEYLRDNIDSVQSQSFSDYEHVIIDGFSHDRTKDIILEYQKTSPSKVKFFQSVPKGIADAMNKGIGQCSGEYIIHLHSDDYFHDDRVLGDVDLFLEHNKNPDWIYSKEISVDSKGKEIRVINDRAIFKKGSAAFYSRYLLKYYDFIRHQSVFIRKDIFERFGNFNSSFPIAMDYEYWLRIRNKTHWLFFNRITDCFRMHDDGASSAPASKIKMQLDEMKAGKMHMNWLEFYLMRPIFKIAAKLAAEIGQQRSLYSSFIATEGERDKQP